MTFERITDIAIFYEFSKGDKTLYRDANYLRAEAHWNKDKLFMEKTTGGEGAYAVTLRKTYCRLLYIVVNPTARGRGIGKAMMRRLIKVCRARGLRKITLRCNKENGIAEFYKQFGGKITGAKDGDWEMEIPVCFTS